MLFGRRSEKLPPISSEVRRIVEADELTVDEQPMPKDSEERDACLWDINSHPGRLDPVAGAI